MPKNSGYDAGSGVPGSGKKKGHSSSKQTKAVNHTVGSERTVKNVSGHADIRKSK
jgi:hypothetical protein